jgi:pilus assembly protein CpaF
MVALTIQAPGIPTSTIDLDEFPCRIGRQRSCEVVLSSWRVARFHAQLKRDGQFLTLIDQGSLAGTWVNGTRIVEYSPLSDDDEITVAGFNLRLSGVDQRFSASRTTKDPDNNADDAGFVAHGAADPVTSDPLLDQRRRLHRALLDTMDLRRQEIRHLDPDQLRAKARAHLVSILPGTVGEHLDEETSDTLVDSVLDEAIGLGVLEQLLEGDEITEIMVNGCDSVYIEKHGRLSDTGLRFSSDAAILSVIERIVSPLGRRIDDSSPMVDARLADGSRVNAVIPPLAVDGPSITIRRFNSHQFTSKDLVEIGSLSKDMLTFLKWSVSMRRNIVVSGGTGSGKTTLLNLLGSEIDLAERLVTIEDAAELQLKHPNKVSLEARPANNEGRGTVTIRDLVRNALRMRPDRIIVGECRGGEALDMLQAMNTGHDGSLTTIHANSARDALARLEVMVLMSGVEIPVQAIREQIASAVDLIVQQQRSRDGRRRIVEIVEIGGMEGSRIQSQAVFRFDSGQNLFVSTGDVPLAFDQLEVSHDDPIRSLFGEAA